MRASILNGNRARRQEGGENGYDFRGLQGHSRKLKKPCSTFFCLRMVIEGAAASAELVWIVEVDIRRP